MTPDAIQEVIQKELDVISRAIDNAKEVLRRHLDDDFSTPSLQDDLDLLRDLRLAHSLLSSEREYIRSEADVEDRIKLLGDSMLERLCEVPPTPQYMARALRDTRAFLLTLIKKP